MKKHSISIRGHRTSVSVEDEFWQVLNAIAAERNLSLNALITEIDIARGRQNLSSAIRLHVLNHLQGRLAQFNQATH